MWCSCTLSITSQDGEMYTDGQQFIPAVTQTVVKTLLSFLSSSPELLLFISTTIKNTWVRFRLQSLPAAVVIFKIYPWLPSPVSNKNPWLCSLQCFSRALKLFMAVAGCTRMPSGVVEKDCMKIRRTVVYGPVEADSPEVCLMLRDILSLMWAFGSKSEWVDSRGVFRVTNGKQSSHLSDPWTGPLSQPQVLFESHVSNCRLRLQRILLTVFNFLWSTDVSSQHFSEW